jgi:hypothetical protein
MTIFGFCHHLGPLKKKKYWDDDITHTVVRFRYFLIFTLR